MGDAGSDLYARLVVEEKDLITVHLGVCVQPSPGYYAEIYPRSSVTKRGLIMCNSVGIIDNGYTGELIAVFYKTSPEARVEVGDRIAQIIVRRMMSVVWKQVPSFDETERGSGGFGSTGSK